MICPQIRPAFACFFDGGGNKDANPEKNKENLDKKISIQKKNKLDNNLKTLSNKEIQEIKKDLKEKEKKQKIAKLRKTNLDKKQKYPNYIHKMPVPRPCC